jgi:hypothetical protein
MKTKGILSFFVLFTLAVIMAMPGQGEAFDDKFAGTYFAAGETGICYPHVTSMLPHVTSHLLQTTVG